MGEVSEKAIQNGRRGSREWIWNLNREKNIASKEKL